MAKVKKDRLSQEMYDDLKKHPALKNPILIAYVVTPAIVIAGALIYYFLK